MLFRSATEAAQVESRHAVSCLREGRDDMTPGPPALGEAVDQESQGTGTNQGLRARQRNMETGAAGGEVAVGPGAGAIDVNRHGRSLLAGARPRPRGCRALSARADSAHHGRGPSARPGASSNGRGPSTRTGTEIPHLAESFQYYLVAYTVDVTVSYAYFEFFVHCFFVLKMI